MTMNNGSNFPQAGRHLPPSHQQWPTASKQQYSGNSHHNNNDFSANNNNQAQQHNKYNNGGGGGRMMNNVNNSSNNNNAANNYYSSQQTNNNFSSKKKMSFQVLYTHQKTKKKKTWKDGRLILHGHGGNGSLYDAGSSGGGVGGGVGLANGPAALDTITLTPSQVTAVANGNLDELESEKFLIQVEGVWTDTSLSNSMQSSMNKSGAFSGTQKL